MRSTPFYRVAAAGIAVGALLAVPLATAGPICAPPVPEAACGDRVIAEPLTTTTFVQYDGEVFEALAAIEAIAPDAVEVYELADLTGNAAHTSFEGRPIPVVRLTDETAPAAGKRKVVFSLSVHANESAGREGGLRYIEDVARWMRDEPDHEVYTGDTAFPISEVLAETEVWLGIANPDGWAYGDLGNSNGVFQRGNGNGVDLNRQFPTLGWPHPSQTPMSEPESDGWAQFVSSLGHVTTASDIHGELTSANNAFSDLMWPADQWTPREQAQELQLGVNVTRTIERKFDEYAVVLGDITGASATMKPAAAATGYDVVGYDDAGFMGDWFSQATGAIDIDAENFLSHLAPGNIWVGALEQAHVAAVRGIIEAVTVESMITGQVEPTLDLGRVAYVFDPVRVVAPAVAASGDDRGRAAVDVSRMLYFEHLAADAGQPVTPIDAADIATADLSAYDSLVLADVAMPTDRLGRPVDAEDYVAALEAFATGGGQLVLTDAAIPVLAQMGFGNEDAIQEAHTNAGHMVFGTRDHPWEQALMPTASQTYYEVPLGFPATNSAPHYGVATEAWETAGGVTVATVDGDTTFTGLGELPRGQGKISIFGAVLPTPSVEDEPEDGLASYGVTIAGGQVFHAMLSYRRPGAAPVPVSPPAPAPVQPGPAPAPLPATGGGVADLPVIVLLLGVGVTAATRRRRRAV